MSEALFLFGGRLNRLQYFLAGLLMSVIGGALLFTGMMNIANGGGMPMLAILALLGLVFFWTSLSMQAARIRDIGLSPLFTIVGFAIVYGIIHAITTEMDGTELGSLFSVASIGLQIVASLFMLLMPGDSFSGSEPTSPVDIRNAPDRRSTEMQGQTMARSKPAAATPMAQTYGKPTFGRRGM